MPGSALGASQLFFLERVAQVWVSREPFCPLSKVFSQAPDACHSFRCFLGGLRTSTPQLVTNLPLKLLHSNLRLQHPAHALLPRLLEHLHLGPNLGLPPLPLDVDKVDLPPHLGQLRLQPPPLGLEGVVPDERGVVGGAAGGGGVAVGAGGGGGGGGGGFLGFVAGEVEGLEGGFGGYAGELFLDRGREGW